MPQSPPITFNKNENENDDDTQQREQQAGAVMQRVVHPGGLSNVLGRCGIRALRRER